MPASRKTFGTQISTVHFLSQCHFDFNRCLREGIPYLSTADESDFRTKTLSSEQNPGPAGFRLGFASVVSRRNVEVHKATWESKRAANPLEERRASVSETAPASASATAGSSSSQENEGADKGITLQIPDRYERLLFAQEVTKQKHVSVRFGAPDAPTTEDAERITVFEHRADHTQDRQDLESLRLLFAVSLFF